MTSTARDLPVGAVECETRIPVMLKHELRPSLRRVTAFAIRQLFACIRSQELAVVRVVVAACALYRKRFHPQNILRSLFDHLVAFETENLPMLAFKRKAGQFVIERRDVPRIRVVAELAAAFGNPQVHLSRMRVGVAALAGDVRESELRGRTFVLLHVTLIARHCQMTSAERKAALRVLRHPERGRSIAVQRVATAARALVCAGGKLTAVFVLVAIHAGRMGKRPRHVPAHVARPAVYAAVRAFQGVFRPGMVERRANDCRKAGRDMAVLAVLSELTVMLVLVTRCAVGIGQPCIRRVFSDMICLLKLVRIRARRSLPDMALAAIHHGVRAGQRVARLRMGEVTRRIPCREGVTLQAVVGDLIPVFVFVAIRAARAQAQECVGKVHVLSALHRLIRDETGFVARSTVFPAMRSMQDVPGPGMIECLPAVRPVNQIEVHPVVLRVARGTPGTLHVGGAVEAGPRRHACPYGGMAIEALGIRHILPEFVALRAVGNPLEWLMRVRKFAG